MMNASFCMQCTIFRMSCEGERTGDKQNGGENPVNAVRCVENKDAESTETVCRVVNEEWGEHGKTVSYGQ